ncbi:hypothetical protein BKA65DRAFT_394888 [Rhexocercosporidium sp. MPI-PUGE-AT-0058]|nr:hypothetical protein BKA65DRAFT_394888 [Rhexocercosporidium sp. MPI-PUGE-AT-0058]
MYLQPPTRINERPDFRTNSSSSGDQKQPYQQDLGLRNANSITYAASTSSSQSKLQDDDEILSQALAFTQHPRHIKSHQAPLPNPIAIPQTKPGLAEAYFRAWAPALASRDIGQVEFLAFIDNLNVVATKNPPLQIVDLAGGILGMVPHHWFAFAGMAVQATAKLGTAAVSKGRTELYMREVNKKLFEPRGLKVSIASSLATRKILKVPGSLPKLAPLTDDTFYISTAERVLRLVAPYSAHLDFDVPPPIEQTTIFAKLSARQVASSDKKNHKKMMKKRDKEVSKSERREKKAEREADRKERKRERKGRKRGKDSDGSDSSHSDNEDERHSRNSSSKIGKGDLKMKKDKEEKGAGKLLWIVIEDI